MGRQALDETPDLGVPELNFLEVIGVCLPDSLEAPIFDLLGSLVPHDGLELWLLQADIQEEGTLVSWVQLPHDHVLGTQRKKVPLPDGVEGSWC